MFITDYTYGFTMAYRNILSKGSLLALSICFSLILVGCSSKQESVNVANEIIAMLPEMLPDNEKGISEYDSKLSDIRTELRRGVSDAEIIVVAYVQESNTVVRASQDEGWAALRIRVDKLLKGKFSNEDILVSNLRGGFTVDLSFFPEIYNFKTGGRYCFFLQENKDISRWCGQKVFDKTKAVELALPLPSQN